MLPYVVLAMQLLNTTPAVPSLQNNNIPVAGQTIPSQDVPANISLPLRWAHEPSWDTLPAPVRIRWWCNKTIIKNYSPTEMTRVSDTGEWQVIIPPLAPGIHNCYLTSYIELDGKTFGDVYSDGAAIRIVAGNITPNPPRGLRLIIEDIKKLLDELVLYVEKK